MLIEARNLPRHVAIIMDGNGRWAEHQGLDRTRGHSQGSQAVRSVVKAARRLGVEALTLFAFSEQNWARPSGEVDALMELLRDYLVSERAELLLREIRFRAVGDVSRLPASVLQVLHPLQEITQHNRGMTLTLALSYGGREEIAQATKRIASLVAAGSLQAEDISPELVGRFIPSVEVGDPDLLIRTGGDLRVSNFLLWGIAYSELFFSQKLWPDFGAEDLFEAIQAFQQRQRRFGLTGQQAQERQVRGVSNPVSARNGLTPSQQDWRS